MIGCLHMTRPLDRKLQTTMIICCPAGCRPSGSTRHAFRRCERKNEKRRNEKTKKLPRSAGRVAVLNFSVMEPLSLTQDVEHEFFDLHVATLGILSDGLLVVLDERLLQEHLFGEELA